jgi:hypothetical protein
MQQQIITNITQGKIQTALESLIAYTNQLKDKELNQRCVLLYSQLSQLQTNFGTGQIDNKTYQMELNRITEAALSAAQTLPASRTFQQPYTMEYQQSQQGYHQAPPAPPQSGNMWKTWGPVMAGALGLFILLLVIGSLMNGNDSTGSTDQSITKSKQLTDNPPVEQEPSVQESEFSEQYFLGDWVGSITINGVNITYSVHLGANHQYSSVATEMASGAQTNDYGTWEISTDGLLSINSDTGSGSTVSRVVWDNDHQFTATIIEAEEPGLKGFKTTYTKS